MRVQRLHWRRLGGRSRLDGSGHSFTHLHVRLRSAHLFDCRCCGRVCCVARALCDAAHVARRCGTWDRSLLSLCVVCVECAHMRDMCVCSPARAVYSLYTNTARIKNNRKKKKTMTWTHSPSVGRPPGPAWGLVKCESDSLLRTVLSSQAQVPRRGARPAGGRPASPQRAGPPPLQADCDDASGCGAAREVPRAEGASSRESSGSSSTMRSCRSSSVTSLIKWVAPLPSITR